jgi:hypothetical protein
MWIDENKKNSSTDISCWNCLVYSCSWQAEMNFRDGWNVSLWTHLPNSTKFQGCNIQFDYKVPPERKIWKGTKKNVVSTLELDTSSKISNSSTVSRARRSIRAAW